MTLLQQTQKAGAVEAGEGPESERAFAILDVARVQLDLAGDVRAVRGRGIVGVVLEMGRLVLGGGVGERQAGYDGSPRGTRDLAREHTLLMRLKAASAGLAVVVVQAFSLLAAAADAGSGRARGQRGRLGGSRAHGDEEGGCWWWSVGGSRRMGGRMMERRWRSTARLARSSFLSGASFAGFPRPSALQEVAPGGPIQPLPQPVTPPSCLLTRVIARSLPPQPTIRPLPVHFRAPSLDRHCYNLPGTLTGRPFGLQTRRHRSACPRECRSGNCEPPLARLFKL